MNLPVMVVCSLLLVGGIAAVYRYQKRALLPLIPVVFWTFWLAFVISEYLHPAGDPDLGFYIGSLIWSLAASLAFLLLMWPVAQLMAQLRKR